MPAPFNHRSGVPAVFDRTPDYPYWARVLFREGPFLQGAELMEAQSIHERRGRRVGDLIAADGNRVAGAEIVVDVDAETVTLTEGKIYIGGDVRPVAEAVLTEVPMTGSVRIGVRLSRTVTTEIQDTALLGLAEGTEAEGEQGAARESETIAWAMDGDGGTGDFYAVYLLRDGTAIDQTPPPVLSGVNAAIATYDRDANGNYVVKGCRVTALGKTGGDQVFSIEAGVANIYGFKRTRYSALRHAQAETFDVETVDAEPHTFADSGSGTVTIPVAHTPISTINTVIVVKETTEAVTRGGTTNGVDALAHTGVTEVSDVSQGATTYIEGVDYTVSGDQISWALGGAEPAPGSSYNVTYRYLDAVAPDSFDDTSVTITGGVTGTQVLIGYDWKLPRIDLLCLDQYGGAVYLKGVSSRSGARAPIAPGNLLRVATIVNNWTGAPAVVNTDVRSIPYEEQWRYFYRLFDLYHLVALERLKSNIDRREPVAKKGLFVDPFTSDYYRDAGEAQTAAVFGQAMQLAIDPSFHETDLDAPALLDWTEEIIVEQPLVTGCMKINPYQTFRPIPGALELTPSSDYWTERRTDWLSDVTREFNRSASGVFPSLSSARIGSWDPVTGAVTTTSQTTDVELVDERQELLEFLREIDIDFVVRGFGAGEDLSELLFDGVDVTPVGLSADAGGVVSGTFTIPANVTAGVKAVEATGAAGSVARAAFVGQGTLDIDVMQRVITQTRVTTWIEQDPEFANEFGVPNSTDFGTGGDDPLAQTFWLNSPRFLAGVDIRFCAIGDTSKPVVVEMVQVDNGWPTRRVITQATIDMSTVAVDEWTEVRFPMPSFFRHDRQYSFVVKTDDPDHALAYAGLGDFDAEAQEFVSAQPYAIGVLLSSSNALTWTPHQDRDLAFRLVAAKFNPTTKTIPLGDHLIVNGSDIVVRAAVDLPTAAASVVFEIVRADASVVRLLPSQLWQLSEFVNETVTLRAVLTGSATISPILFPRPLLVAGTIRTEGTYVTRAFDFGTAIRLTSYIKALLPAGSALAVEYDEADDDWQTLTLASTDVLNDGWIERKNEVDPITATVGRIRLTLTGGPAARPLLSDFCAMIV